MNGNDSEKSETNGILAKNTDDNSKGFDNPGANTEDEAVQSPTAIDKHDHVELNNVSSARTSVSWGDDVKTVRSFFTYMYRIKILETFKNVSSSDHNTWCSRKCCGHSETHQLFT